MLKSLNKYFQILTSVVQEYTAVTLMLSALTPKVLTTALVNQDIMETERIVKVFILFFFPFSTLL